MPSGRALTSKMEVKKDCMQVFKKLRAKIGVHPTKHHQHWLRFVPVVCLIPLLLAGCGNKQASNSNATNNNVTATQQSQPANAMYLYQGKPMLYGRFISVPMIVTNVGVNTLPLNTALIKCQIDYQTTHKQKKLFGYKTVSENHTLTLDSYSPTDAPSTFNLQMQNNDQLQTFMLFKMTPKQYRTVSQDEIAKAKLTFTTPTHKKMVAHLIPSSTTKGQLQGQYSLNKPTALSDYYGNLDNVQQDVKQQKPKNSKDASSIANDDYQSNYNDPDYAKLKFTVHNFGNHAVFFEINNQTQEPMNLALNNFELQGKHETDVLIAPQFNDYSLYIPQERTTYAILPTNVTLNTNIAYTPLIAKSSDDASGGGNWLNTKDLPNAIQYRMQTVSESE